MAGTLQAQEGRVGDLTPASQFNNTRTHESTGIQNILDRIKLIEMKYNLKMGFQIIDKSELDPQTTGTIVRLSVPLEVTYSEF